ncbi:DUF6461 domain-containing protein [Streptomyces boluensis]|uniref:Uncharacterized protein n=1 Tax=Streptomyces boluensis TaxID=1775135 RepID=A0A964XPJ7_9ACTN|nr:DUF6461 domain-containing protein [Streptomyces boluensis]NBE54653.1 hypothetical protein [Streptomyces boluensis]
MQDSNPLAWIAKFHDCHSLTLVDGITAQELLSRLGCPSESVRPQAEVEDIDELLEEAAEDDEEYGIVYAGVAGGWAWAFEPQTLWAFNDETRAAASRGARLIGCWHNGNALGYVDLWVDGTLVTMFDADHPELRHEQRGEDPDRILDAMREAGFLDSGRDEGDVLPQYRALALLHAYTGVTLTGDDVRAGLVAEIPAAE